MKTQTAVDWYSEKLLGILGSSVNGFSKEQTLANHYALKEAKAMEKKQIMDCCVQTTQDCWTALMDEIGKPLVFTDADIQKQKEEAEEYYNEVFGGDK